MLFNSNFEYAKLIIRTLIDHVERNNDRNMSISDSFTECAYAKKHVETKNLQYHALNKTHFLYEKLQLEKLYTYSRNYMNVKDS